ncbi:histidinol-phosphate transaminase [Vulcanibacillus modesticaldus]|uniref:Histidinol-phosphate aminotransferase n=1 Tax=Vulcanibacillus modesticaldus TaxID=337097 RepID=A0A1D2YV61_9BACI|nr:histidinol-phosphate transaminase [Vulcanibacillus modesticaldus]OEF99563.1 histidinol-phosphate transaminase [Vulcanibacillus modesticaldus]
MTQVKESLINFRGYKSKQVPYKIRLNANEGKNILLEDIIREGLQFNEEINLNFYPDNDATLLKAEISKYIGVSPANIVVGNGSSEMIELIIKTYVDKNETILSVVPTFSMYAVFSQIYSTKFVGVESNEDFSIDIEKLIDKANEINPKVIILCNPNNPTGNLLPTRDIKKLLENTNSLVVIDEAYMEFASGSMVEEISNYENLIVLRTLSKAFGLAGIRVGYLLANQKIVNIIDQVRSPYNLNVMSQWIATKALKNKERVIAYIEEIKLGREFLYNKLKENGMKVFKSHGNFLLFYSNIDNLGQKLAEKGILIRSFANELAGYYRVSVGDKSENQAFIKAIEEITKNEKGKN